MKKKKKKIGKKFCVMICKGGGVFVPMAIFPNINIHKNINCHLKV